MKKLILSALAVVTVASVITSCKKGSEDPGMSLRSRKGRVSGVWKVSSWTETTTSTYNDNRTTNNNSGSSTQTVTSTDGATISSVDNSTDTRTNASVTTTTSSTTTLNGKITTATWEFKSDGTWTSTMDITFTTKTEVPAPSSLPTSYSNSWKEVSTGVWNFLGSVDANTKNKEEMAVSTLETTTTSNYSEAYTGSSYTSGPNVTTEKFARNENVETWRLVRLANKEMKVTKTGDKSTSGTTSYTNVSGSVTTTTTGTRPSNTSKVAGSFTLIQ